MLLKILQAGDKQKVIDYIEKLPAEKRYTVDIKLKRNQRSTDQNRLYWLWLSCLMEETGEHKDRLHEFFKQYYLGADQHLAFGKYPVMVARSTAVLDTKQMTDYLNRVQQFASVELGIVLPNPEDLQFAEFEAHYKNFI